MHRQSESNLNHAFTTGIFEHEGINMYGLDAQVNMARTDPLNPSKTAKRQAATNEHDFEGVRRLTPTRDTVGDKIRSKRHMIAEGRCEGRVAHRYIHGWHKEGKGG
jgi:hypothetical protein